MTAWFSSSNFGWFVVIVLVSLIGGLAVWGRASARAQSAGARRADVMGEQLADVADSYVDDTPVT